MRKNTLDNILYKLFSSSKQKEWNKNHILYWGKSLELDDSGFSVFQNELIGKLKQVLNDNNISFVSEVTEHSDLNDKNKIVKMILLTLDENSKFWVYHDMADFIIKNESQIYEEWGYLKPEDLINEYLKSAKELLKIKNKGIEYQD